MKQDAAGVEFQSPLPRSEPRWPVLDGRWSRPQFRPKWEKSLRSRGAEGRDRMTTW